jgi:hypothetical protein
MPKTFYILLFCFSHLYSNGQIIDNKINLSLGYIAGKFGGDEMFHNKGFISPSLYSNYDNLNGISFKGIFLKNQLFNFGASINYFSVSEWNTDSYTDYLNSGVKQYSFAPLVQIHNKLAECGFLNRVGFFLEIAPTLGLSKLSLSNPLIEIHNGNTVIEQPAGSNDLFWGIKGGIGIEASINQDIALFLGSFTGYYLVNSKMYADTHFTNYSLEAGIIVKLLKNKRYFY